MRGSRAKQLREAVGIPFFHREFADPHKNAWRRAKRAYNRTPSAMPADPGGVPVARPGAGAIPGEPARIWMNPIQQVHKFFGRCGRAQRDRLIKLAKIAGTLSRQYVEYAVKTIALEVGYT